MKCWKALSQCHSFINWTRKRQNRGMNFSANASLRCANPKRGRKRCRRDCGTQKRIPTAYLVMMGMMKTGRVRWCV